MTNKLTFKFKPFINNLSNLALIRFLFVSGLNTLFGYGLFALLIYVNMHYQIALLISTICGILFNFKTIGSIVFGNNNAKLIFKFIAVYGIVYTINIIGLKILMSYNFNSYTSMAILIVPMAILAFLLNKEFVFNNINSKHK